MKNTWFNEYIRLLESGEFNKWKSRKKAEQDLSGIYPKIPLKALSDIISGIDQDEKLRQSVEKICNGLSEIEENEFLPEEYSDYSSYLGQYISWYMYKTDFCNTNSILDKSIIKDILYKYFSEALRGNEIDSRDSILLASIEEMRFFDLEGSRK